MKDTRNTRNEMSWSLIKFFTKVNVEVYLSHTNYAEMDPRSNESKETINVINTGKQSKKKCNLSNYHRHGKLNKLNRDEVDSSLIPKIPYSKA